MTVLRSASIVMTAVLASAVSDARAQQPQEPPTGPVLQWLLNSCGVIEHPRELVDLGALGPRVVDELIAAFASGPTARMTAEAEEAARERHARRRALLERGTGLGLSAADVALASQVSRERYVAQARADFEHRYRAEALRGLAAVGGAPARSVLTGIAADSTSPFQATARTSLERLRLP